MTWSWADFLSGGLTGFALTVLWVFVKGLRRLRRAEPPDYYRLILEVAKREKAAREAKRKRG